MSDNALLEALPPKTDYLTYLTILEYNLTVDRLPTLHNLLQDITLTTNIGWDLVHILLPLLPASESCLQDVARLGNPREVILKVTELLESLGDDIDGDDETDEDLTQEEDAGPLGEHDKSPAPTDLKYDIASNYANHASPSIQSGKSFTPPSRVLQFQVLLNMLSVLHPRIKTEYPSRFLSTSIQAIVPAYAHLASETTVTDAVVGFIRSVSGARRPQLPPRNSSTTLRRPDRGQVAPDPEAQSGPSAPEETEVQIRLLCSFLTHIIENYIRCLPLVGEAPGLAWTIRLQERMNPAKVVPRRQTYTSMFTEDETLHQRDTIIGQLVALTRDLLFDPKELLSLISEPEIQTSEGSEGVPSSLSAIPSHTGALYLFAALQVSSSLFRAPLSLPQINIFPNHSAILETFIGDEAMGGVGMQRDTLIDAVLFLGFSSLDEKRIGEPDDDLQFNKYLQRLSLLSANIPSPTLRYHAHILASTVLHAHPSDHVRLSFIRDTLEHCPYENLKVSAVGWLKDEILAATANGKDEEEATLFTSPTAIESVAPFLFSAPDVAESQSEDFGTLIPFYLAILNFHYLLCSSPLIAQSLDMATVNRKYTIEETFITRLEVLSGEVKKRGLQSEAPLEDGDGEEGSHLFILSELQLLDHAISRVRGAMAAIAKV